ncbi:TrmH family RNA methyltransferase [Flavobacterium sp. CS20]|uniref:TrmH family RNA methyltransferase n=1 Tax=Flavobacterium sp. CS20 TaxID=2775246 RepID=UPI001B39F502|nr:TrmH family RNA methyltransferase [Flavobacterium sp. CS20]QTY25980.1 TrmH family RNA methyltransferase [Flavobacterium sp. CS20]
MRKLKNEELNRLSVEDYKSSRKSKLILILDNIRSLNNIGSVFRTADAFRIQKIYLCSITAQPPHRDIQKTALGATDSVEWAYDKETLNVVEKLKQNGIKILSIEQADESCMLQDFKFESDETYAMIFGNEVKGVQQAVIDQSDEVLEIPQFGTKHSVNISVSVGICCWQFVQSSNFRG